MTRAPRGADDDLREALFLGEMGILLGIGGPQWQHDEKGRSLPFCTFYPDGTTMMFGYFYKLEADAKAAYRLINIDGTMKTLKGELYTWISRLG